MTFSRRAATEMTRRVERIARHVMGDRAGVMTDALTWAGTFHGIGAQLLRDYAEQIELEPSFTIHDREDSADLINLVRHEIGLSKTKSRFPMKGTCLAIYSRCVNAELAIEEVLKTSFPWCAAWAADPEPTSRTMRGDFRLCAISTPKLLASLSEWWPKPRAW